MRIMRTLETFILWISAGISVLAGMNVASNTAIDDSVVAQWSKPYQNWSYYPSPIIPADFQIKGAENSHSFDVPCVYLLPDNPNVWYMSFIGFDGQGYNSFVVQSEDLVSWHSAQTAMGFGKDGAFDHGGCVLGAYLYENWNVDAPRVLKKLDGIFYSLYGAYPRQGGYELRPGYEGLAMSDDGIHWTRAAEQPILSVYQKDCQEWEKDCIYQPWLVEHQGTYYNFYNAANGNVEQSGLALSNDLVHWIRYPLNPVIKNGNSTWDENFASDPKVFRDGDHWVMFYFGVGNGGASIMVAFSRDLVHWTTRREPLYKFGQHPNGLDQQYAHKISLVFNPKNDTFYMFYCAVGNQGRTIALLTSKPLLSVNP
jgi:beta-xylosidase